MWYQDIRSVLFYFVTKHARDRQRDGQTNSRVSRGTLALFVNTVNNSQDRASVAASRDKNESINKMSSDYIYVLSLQKCIAQNDNDTNTL